MTKPLALSHRIRLRDMDPEELVRVYTWQHVDGWEASKERGHLTGSHGRPHEEDLWDGPYEWMRSAMAERIPGFSGDLPVWTWLKRENPRRAHWIRDRVRIIADVPRGRMLLSDYELWHLPLNRGAICLTPEEDEAYPHDTAGDAIMDTWHHVLDIVGGPHRTRDWLGVPDTIQACVDRIGIDEIVSVRMPGR